MPKYEPDFFARSSVLHCSQNHLLIRSSYHCFVPYFVGGEGKKMGPSGRGHGREAVCGYIYSPGGPATFVRALRCGTFKRMAKDLYRALTLREVMQVMHATLKPTNGRRWRYCGTSKARQAKL